MRISIFYINGVAQTLSEQLRYYLKKKLYCFPFKQPILIKLYFQSEKSSINGIETISKKISGWNKKNIN